MQPLAFNWLSTAGFQRGASAKLPRCSGPLLRPRRLGSGAVGTDDNAMKLKDFIVYDAVIASLAAKDRDAVLRELVVSLATAGALDASAVEDVVAALIKREREATTGFGKGVAVPHVKHPKVKKMAATVARSETGVDFAALDHQPVHCIVLLLSPDNAPQQHLQAMTIVFSNLQKDMFRKFLRQSDTKQKIVDLLEEADAGR